MCGDSCDVDAMSTLARSQLNDSSACRQNDSKIRLAPCPPGRQRALSDSVHLSSSSVSSASSSRVHATSRSASNTSLLGSAILAGADSGRLGAYDRHCMRDQKASNVWNGSPPLPSTSHGS